MILPRFSNNGIVLAWIKGSVSDFLENHSIKIINEPKSANDHINIMRVFNIPTDEYTTVSGSSNNFIDRKKIIVNNVLQIIIDIRLIQLDLVYVKLNIMMMV